MKKLSLAEILIMNNLQQLFICFLLVAFYQNSNFAQNSGNINIKGTLKRSGLTSNLDKYNVQLVVYYETLDSVIYDSKIDKRSQFEFNVSTSKKPVKLFVIGYNGLTEIDRRNIVFNSQDNRVVANCILIERRTQNLSAGDELREFSKKMYMGYSLTTLGSGVFIVSTFTNFSDGKVPVFGYAVGGALTLFGTYFILEAPIHINRAGLILNQNGIGVKINF